MYRLRFPLLPDQIRWIGVLAVAGALLFFSLLATPPSGPPGPPSQDPYLDKKLHLAGYAALGLSLIYATAASQRRTTRRAVLTVGAAVAFGILIEVLQGPLPERYFSYADMLANALGALLASGWFLVESRLEYVRFPRRPNAE